MHKVQCFQPRINARKQDRNNRKVLRDIVCDAERRQRAARHQKLFSDAHHFDEFGRAGIQIDHVARLFRRLRSRVHRNCDICLRKGGCVIGTVARHCNQVSFRLQFFDQSKFGFGRCLGDKIIHPRFGSDCRRRHGIIARDHDRLDADLSQVFKLFFYALFYDIFEIYDAEDLLISCNDQRSAAFVCDFLHGFSAFIGIRAAQRFDIRFDCVCAAFPDMLFADVDAAHTGFRRKFDKGGFHFGNFLAAQAEFIFRQHDDAPSLSRFVGNGRKLRRFRKIAFRSIPHGNKFACLSVAERDRTRFIQQQNIDVSRRFDRTSAGRKYVCLI